ncbi:hypothetical protein D3C76_1205600 [compost metagenome]
MLLQQRRTKLSHIARLHVGSSVNAIPRQRVIFELLAGFRLFSASRHDDIRGHAFTLGTAAIHAIELLNGVLYRTQRRPFRAQHLIVNAVQGTVLLHRTFTECRFADNQGTTIILHRRGKDF